MFIETAAESAVSGKDLAFNFTVTNLGLKPASSVLLEVSLGQQTNFVSLLPDGECISSSCNFRSLGANDSVTGQLILRPYLGFNREISVRVEVSGIQPELNKRNNESSVTLPLLLADDQPGSLFWSVDLPRPSDLVVGADAVYLSSSNGLYALNQATGEVLWRYWAEGDPTPSVVDGGTVYFGSSGGRVYAADASTGVLRWNYRTGEEIELELVVSGGSVYFQAGGYLISLDAPSGNLNWRYQTGVLNPGRPVVVGESVYFRARGDLFSLDAMSGSLNWRKESFGYDPPTVTGANVYFQAGSSVVSLDVSSGSPNWVYEPESDLGDPVGLLVSGNSVYFGSDLGAFVYSLDSSSGNLNWRYEYDSGRWAIPMVADGSVYFGGESRSVYSLDARSGNLNWQYRLDSRPRSSEPILLRISGGSVYFWSGNSLHSLDASTGMLLWQFDAGREGSFAVNDGILYGTAWVRVFSLRTSH